jgi:hypothetical protein
MGLNRNWRIAEVSGTVEPFARRIPGVEHADQ